MAPKLIIDLSALGAEVQEIAREAVQRIVDAPAGDLDHAIAREVARLSQGTPAEQTVAEGLRVSFGEGCVDEVA
jgi:hypothetical protein